MAKKLIFVLGGARSGKSRFAQKMAGEIDGQVLFVATAEAGDEEMRARIAAHRQSRPASWRTMEITSGVGQKLKAGAGDARVILIDCLTLLIANVMGSGSAGDAEKRVQAEIEELIAAANTLAASVIIVSNEVGLGLVPDNRLGRDFRDIAGRANQLVAGAATDVYFMMAGLPLKLK